MIKVTKNLDSELNNSEKIKEMNKLLQEIIEKINAAFDSRRSFYTSDAMLIDMVGILHAKMFLYFNAELNLINEKLDKIMKQNNKMIKKI